jgi:hypothetical protein
MAEPRPAWVELPPLVIVEPPAPARRDVHVRIGAVEVRAQTPPAPVQPATARVRSTARGFDDYRAIRSHAGWDL